MSFGQSNETDGGIQLVVILGWVKVDCVCGVYWFSCGRRYIIGCCEYIV